MGNKMRQNTIPDQTRTPTNRTISKPFRLSIYVVCMYVCMLHSGHVSHQGRGGHKEKEKEMGKTENK